ncbi:18540_t:CDS:2 [Dentiscutata erythropus]|uniref:18540_t:CDS:1 n=1 Tax=Dentiscutata erythropus TaxID=1348616 RepID=A0A9N9FCU5_9GLOM|nr:18540_t:CDS:2 [Dentiscutata erythropus]
MADNIDNNDYLSVTPSLRVNNSEGRGSDADITVPTPPISSPPISSPPTPRRSLYISNLSNAQNIQSSAALKKQLQDQLKEYSDQLKLTDELSAALKKQQLEIDNQIKALDKTEGDEVPQEIRSKLADLEKELTDINTKSTKVLLRSNISAAVKSPTSSTPTTPATEVPSTVTGKSSSRRDRNAAKGRQKDIEFATEIGQGLLQEVRRLQALLQEKEEKIKELEAEKAELERNIEQLNKTLRAKEDSEDRLNKYVETLELTRQELSNQLEDLQQQLSRARSDYTKIEKALATATDVIEQLKDKEEKLTASLENLKIRHEKDMQNNRRHIAALNREKSDLTQTIDDLKSQLDTFLNASKIKKSTKEMATGSNNNLSYGEDGQVISGDDIDSAFPQDLINKNLNAKDTMKALGVANRMIGNLRANLQKEKSEKYELKKLLIDSQEQIEAMQAEIYDVTANPNQFKRRQINNLPGELSDVSESDAVSTNSEKINKNNRPSSDWFTSDKSKRRLMSERSRSSLLSRESADVDIIPGEDEDDETKEIVEARRAEALRKLGDNNNVLSREIVGEPGTLDDDTYENSDKNSDIRHKDSVVRRRVTEYEDINKQIADDENVTRRGNSQSEPRSPNDNKRRTDSESSYIEDISPNDDKRRTDSGNSHIEDSSPATRSISGEITIPKNISGKEFRNIGVQTDSGERSDSMTTFGNNRDTAIFDNNSQDSKIDPTSQSNLSVPDNNNENKRFTLDLSNNQQSRPRGILQNSSKPQSPVQSLDPPPRPINGPSASLIQRSASVNFGQQAGTSKVQQSLNGAHKSSADSQDGILSSKPKTRDINNLSVGEPTSTLHNHSSSSGSISTSSSASITAEQANKSAEHNGSLVGPSGTDPTVIHAITQTMIGEYLWKYTRRNFGVDKRHKRFFWVHPYTKTLYWSNKDPSNHEPVDPKSKSGTSYFAYIESVRQVVDHNPSPPGLHHMSLIIKTPERELKITARSKERHEYWYQVCSPSNTEVASDPWDKQPTRNLFDSTSPTGSLKDGNLKKKSSFNKIQSMFRRNESPLSSEYIDGQSQQLAAML